MGGDYTRFTSDPRKSHAAVLMQQGRVLVDADVNELVELIDRRLRAETVDVVGACAVPREPPGASEGAFQLFPSAGTLALGSGRAYVDGIQVENLGGPPWEADPVLGGIRGTTRTTYDTQPFWPEPGRPALPASGTHLVYLDVWERELTAAQDTTLVDKAIGIDTSTRVQTVWQVKVLAPDGGATLRCNTEPDKIEGWLDATRPSAGRLTTAGVGAPAPTDPCDLPPEAGYRGTENRLYRVEIHEGGPLGTATFKWSRDNASFAMAVIGIDGARTTLTVPQPVRDSVLRFASGDWIEIQDEARELNGDLGILAKVDAVDAVGGTVTIRSSDALPSGTFDPDARNTWVRRWDQTGALTDSNGSPVDFDAGAGAAPTSAAAGATLVLEDGVRIGFSVAEADGSFHRGDHWLFAARTADASVEELDEAPPRGILHHYCKLGVVTFPSTVVDDCRVKWPPEGTGAGCDCTVCVTPESHAGGSLTVQAAVDSVKKKGGKVCLEPGVYQLTKQLVIDGAASLVLAGHGWKTMLVHVGEGPAVIVRRSTGVTIEELTLACSQKQTTGKLERIGIQITSSLGVTVQRCLIAETASLAGFGLAGFDQKVVDAGTNAAAFAETGIALDGFVAGCVIRENVIVTPTGIRSHAVAVSAADLQAPGVTLGRKLGASGKSGYLLTAGLWIEDNLLACQLQGVDLGSFQPAKQDKLGVSIHLGDTRISGNSIYGAAGGAIAVTGLVPTAAKQISTSPLLAQALAAAEKTAGTLGRLTLSVADGSRIEIAGNLLAVAGTGIIVGSDNARITDNDVAGRGSTVAGDGIVLAPGVDRTGIDACQVTGNRISGLNGMGIRVTGPVLSGSIVDNVVRGAVEAGISMDASVEAGTLTIQGNLVLGVTASPTDQTADVVGIRAGTADRVDVIANTIGDIGSDARVSQIRAGIQVVATRSAAIRISDNDVADVGPPNPFVNIAAGIDIVAPIDRLDVSGNTVRPPQATGADSTSRPFVALLIGQLPGTTTTLGGFLPAVEAAGVGVAAGVAASEAAAPSAAAGAAPSAAASAAGAAPAAQPTGPAAEAAPAQAAGPTAPTRSAGPAASVGARLSTPPPTIRAQAAPVSAQQAGVVSSSAAANVAPSVTASPFLDASALVDERARLLPLEFATVRGDTAAIAGDAASLIIFLPSGMVAVRGNTFEANGSAPSVVISGELACTFSDNQCIVTSTVRPSAVYIQSIVTIATGNLVGPFTQVPALDLHAPRATVLGNIAQPIQLNNAALGAPWAPLNT
jgi:hypothetical protein